MREKIINKRKERKKKEEKESREDIFVYVIP
jgi:hypothetical protein